MTDPASPAVTRTYLTPPNVVGLAVSGTDLYAAAGANVWRYGLADPARPALLNSFGTAGSFVAVQGSYVYIGDFQNKLYIYDITNPAAPQQRGVYTANGTVKKLAIQGRYAHLLAAPWGSPGYLEIVDINDPAAPTRVGQLQLAGQAVDMALLESDHLVYALYNQDDTSRGLQIINVADVAHPTSVRTLPTAGQPAALALAGNTAFVASWTAQDECWFVEAFDTTDRPNPVLRTTGTGIGSSISDVEAVDDLLIGSLVKKGIYVWDAGQWAQTQTSEVSEDFGSLGSLSFEPELLGSAEVPEPLTPATPTHTPTSTATATEIPYLTPATPTHTPTTTPTATPTSTPIVEAVKSVNPAFYRDVVAPGEMMTYTISLLWDSPDGSPALGSAMSDAIPSYCDYVPGSATANLGQVQYQGDADTGTILWGAASVPDGFQVIITFKVRLDLSELPASRLGWPARIENVASGNLGPLPFTAARATFIFNPVVNTTGDTVAGNPHDGICGQDGTPCSLREAIAETNYHPNRGTSDVISFNIPTAAAASVEADSIPVITIGSTLPTITDPVVIDGTTQPGDNQVKVDGNRNRYDGLRIIAGNSTVKGLVIRLSVRLATRFATTSLRTTAITASPSSAARP